MLHSRQSSEVSITEFDTNYRSTLDILWTCLLTIFACTWISVHPNVVGYRSTWRQTFIARMELMLWAIFAPELIVVFAFRQWSGARRIGSTMRGVLRARGDAVSKRWTEAHSHLLQMGGFIFREGDGRVHYVDLALEEVGDSSSSVHSAVTTPAPQNSILAALADASISEAEIWDRSKGDVFAKSFVIVQTLWFVVQCSARAAQNLDLTHLEVTTLAYAVMTGAMYFFWWNKPLDVQYPIVVDLVPSGSRVSGRLPSLVPVALPTQPDPIYLNDDLKHERELLGNSPNSRRSNRRLGKGIGTSLRRARQSETWISLAQRGTSLMKGVTSRLQSIVEYKRQERSSSVFETTSYPTFHALPLIPPLEAANSGLSTNHSLTQLMGLVLASVFGAIHCIAWNFGGTTLNDQPTEVFRLLWRISALTITSSPGILICLFVIIFVFRVYRKRNAHGSFNSWYIPPLIFLVKILRYSGQVVIFLYVPARLILVVLAFFEFTMLTPSMHRTVEWSSFLPHV